MRLRDVGLALWELPQDTLGLLLLGAARALGAVVAIERDQGRLFIESRSLGVSLGYFVFWSRGKNRYFRADSLMKRHEYGHTFCRWTGRSDLRPAPRIQPTSGRPGHRQQRRRTGCRRPRRRLWLWADQRF